ncbi:MAG: hypothetical protein Q9208_002770 [Pyrenodesmia sp. 3 TL-2023]
MMTSRNRIIWGMIGWFPTTLHSNENSAHDKALTLLSPQQIRDNTSRGTTPGLIHPLLGEAGGRVIMPKSNMGAGKRRGPRAPGIRHGGGNHQEKYKAKLENDKVQKRKVEFEDLEASRAPKIARAGSPRPVPGNSDATGSDRATSEASLRETISGSRPTLKLGVCGSYCRHMTGKQAETTSPFHLPRPRRTNMTTGNSTHLPVKIINTPLHAPRPLVDGANSSGNTIIHYEPSLSEDDGFNFNDYVNASDTASESEGSLALTGFDRNGETTRGATPLQHGSSVTLGEFTSELASSPGQDVNRVHVQGDSGEPDHGVSDLPAWYDDDLNNFALQRAGSGFPGLLSTDPALSSFLDWDTQDFEN